MQKGFYNISSLLNYNNNINEYFYTSTVIKGALFKRKM